jgi:hypothetical protein
LLRQLSVWFTAQHKSTKDIEDETRTLTISNSRASLDMKSAGLTFWAVM